jgi:hypothetical protein
MMAFGLLGIWIIRENIWINWDLDYLGEHLDYWDLDYWGKYLDRGGIIHLRIHHRDWN